MYTDYLLSFGFTQTQKSDGLSVHVSAHWTLGQLQSDVLQVYFGFAEDESLPGPQELTTLASDTKSPVNLTVPLLGKQVILKMWLAPRLLDSDQVPEPIMPDTEDDDHEWDTYAGSSFAAISYTPGAISTPIAIISSITPHPKTLQAANHFDITCSASGGMIDDFNLIPTENGGELEQLENKRGVFHQISSPGARFQFEGPGSQSVRLGTMVRSCSRDRNGQFSQRCGLYDRKRGELKSSDFAETLCDSQQFLIDAKDARHLSMSGPGTGDDQVILQARRECSVQFSPARGDIENIQRLVRFGVDQHHFDIATGRADGARQIVQKSRTIFGHDLDECRDFGRIVVQNHARLQTRRARGQQRLGTSTQQLRHVLLPLHDAPHDAAETVDFSRDSAPSVRCGSEKVNVSTTTLWAFENASTLRILNPKLEIAPATDANSPARSCVSSVNR